MVTNATGERYPGLLPILTSMKNETCAARVGFAGFLARLAEVWQLCSCAAESSAAESSAAATTPPGSSPRYATPDWPERSWPCTDNPATTGRWRYWLQNATYPGPSSRNSSKPLDQPLAGEKHSQFGGVAQGRHADRDTLPIESVAPRLGYTSQAAFSRTFKRSTGQYPAQAEATVRRRPRPPEAPAGSRGHIQPRDVTPRQSRKRYSKESGTRRAEKRLC